ncbi:MAG: hypothetical protein ACRC1H_00975, partial [Caldilineaceae bacterium]
DTFDPASFRAVLPKNLIHRVVPGESIHSFFEAWEQAARAEIAHRAFGSRQWFVATAETLSRHRWMARWQIDTRRKWLRDGILIVSPPADEKQRMLLRGN